MLFRDLPDGSFLAVSQPMHALVSGQMARAWGAPGFARPEPFEEVAVAAAQHDVAWMGWEAAPTLDRATGRPHLFRAVGARHHAPMWEAGVRLAASAWGPLVGLLVSRHGGLIYGRYTDRHRLDAADGAAVEAYLRNQAPVERELAERAGIGAAAVEAASAIVAATDALSLAACGGIATTGGIGAVALAEGGTARLELEEGEGVLAVRPWPFAVEEVRLQWRARRFAPGVRWEDEDAMRAALRAAPVELCGARLVRG